MLSLRATLTTATVAALVVLAACAPSNGDPVVQAPPDPAAEFVAALPPCAATVTVMQEGTLPPCRPVDHTGDGTGIASQRLDLIMHLTAVNGPSYSYETGHCQSQAGGAGYGGSAAGFNLTTMQLTCRDIDPALAWWMLIAPASIAA